MPAQTLRVIGTPDTLTQAITERAKRDLGFDLTFEPLDGLALQRRVIMEPDSFDIVDHWSTTAELAWDAGVLQPIDTSRIADWRGLAGPDGFDFLELISKDQGSAPGMRMFVQGTGELGPDPTSQIVMLPTVHNCDSFGYCANLSAAKLPDGTAESWSWLLNPAFRGKVALSTHAPISAIEVALAAQACGALEFGTIDNLTVAEIDRLIDLAADLLAQGHFRGFWASSEDAIKLMQTKGGSVQSIWAQGFRAAQKQNASLRYAFPVEGFRGWVDGLALSADLSPEKSDAAYCYLNWWLSGWPGAQMVRSGTYMTNPQSLRPHLRPFEWDDRYGPDTGEAGATYKRRFGHVGVWNSFMDEHNYLTRKWSEFLGQFGH